MSEEQDPDEASARLAGSFGFEAVEPAAKAGLVRRVFDTVAPRYDLMNDLMSLGVHRLWKDSLVDWLAPRPGRRHLDLAGGTGDIAYRIWDRLDGDVELVIADINVAMLDHGRDKAFDTNRFTGLHFVCADAMSLPLADRSVDSATIAFGIRNVTHIDRALVEAFRVLRLGGRFLCLEFSTLAWPALQGVYDRYSFDVLPRIGGVVAGDADSYRYLAESIRRFPDQKTFAQLMSRAGFDQVRYRNLSGGIACLHSGWKL